MNSAHQSQDADKSSRNSVTTPSASQWSSRNIDKRIHGEDGFRETVDSVIRNPLKCSYLLEFCESEYSGESMKFIVAVEKFKDSLSVDAEAWKYADNLDIKAIDSMVGIGCDTNSENGVELGSELYVGDEEKWPSKKVIFEAALQDVRNIWNTFLSNDSKNQICMSTEVLFNTKLRLKNLHLYGGHVFDETLLDPIKTIKRDLLPRFVVSSFYDKMASRLLELRTLPVATSLSLKLPSSSPCTSWDDEHITVENIQKMNTNDMLHDRIIYSSFMNYCKSLYAHENLLCGRAVAIFKCCCKARHNNVEIEESAWTVFKYFVVYGSAYEVSLSHKSRKAIMLSMANPHPQLFAKIERSVFLMIRSHWNNFCKTKFFQSLPHLIREEKYKPVIMRQANEVHSYNEVDDNKKASKTSISSISANFIARICSPPDKMRRK